ncbi:hypothetical protein GH733_007897 [Mirounga leonina]|nr:hypothetical protein GH733_007897 [Mirounga leonina]
MASIYDICLGRGDESLMSCSGSSAPFINDKVIRLIPNTEEEANALKKIYHQLKLQEASDVSLSETQNGDVSEETVGGGKVKKSLKQSVNVGSSEAQNGEIAKETVETIQVKKKKRRNLP